MPFGITYNTIGRERDTERERERSYIKRVSTAVSDRDKQRALMATDQKPSWEKYLPAE